MQIDDILDLVAAGKHPQIAQGWGQGRTTFGGLTAAVLFQAIQNEVSVDRTARSFDINFARPLEALKPYEIEIQTLTNGKTATTIRAYLIQEDKIRATATANFLNEINTVVKIDDFRKPAIKNAAESEPMIRDDLPELFQHFDNRVATTSHPFSGHASRELGGWVKFKEAPSHITTAHLICLIDAWPPTSSTHYKGFKPLSTMSWSLHFAYPTTNVDPQKYIGYLAEVNFSEHGFSSSTAKIWDEPGNLLAISTQTNIIYG